MPWKRTFVLALLVYATGWPLDRLPGGDSGELLAEACVRGVAHPPGYPLLLSLLRIVRWIGGTLFPGVHFVLLANAFNALLTALAAACVTHSVYLIKQSAEIEAVTAGMVFALSKLSWEYARGIEVFGLNNLLVGVLHILVVKHFKNPTTKNACFGAFVCGLGLANQHTIVLFEAPYITWVLMTHWFRVQDLVLISMAFCGGLLVYLQTILSAQEATPGSWGDTSTFTGLFTHVRRKEYGTFQLSPMQGVSEGLMVRLQVYLMDFLDDLSWAGSALICIGALTALVLKPHESRTVQKPSTGWQRRAVLAQMSALLCFLLVFHSLANLPLDAPMPRAVSSRFNMQPNTILAIWFGLGLGNAARGATSIVKANVVWSRIIRYAVCVALVTAQYQRSLPVGNVDLHGDLIREHGKAIFDVMPRDAVLLSYTDINWNVARYLQACEGVRQDVTHLNLQLMPFPWFPRQHALYPTIAFPPIRHDAATVKNSTGYARLLHEFLVANMEQHGDHLFLDLHAVNDADIDSSGRYLGFTLTPNGLVWKVSTPMTSTKAIYSLWSVIPQPETHFAPGVHPAGSWEFAVATIANDARYQSGLFALSHWLERGRSVQHASEAAEYVLGLHRALQLLRQVETALSRAGSKYGLTYEVYDLSKNTALAAMRYTEGLKLISPVLTPLKQDMQRKGARAQELKKLRELEKLVEQETTTWKQTRQRIQKLLPDMKARHDQYINAFKEFVNAKVSKPNSKSKKKRPKHKK